jgi:hypothetical protein
LRRRSSSSVTRKLMRRLRMFTGDLEPGAGEGGLAGAVASPLKSHLVAFT